MSLSPATEGRSSFVHLVRKEFASHLLDLRFLVVFVLCAGLSALGVFTGVESYKSNLQEYDRAAQAQQKVLQDRMEKGNFDGLSYDGHVWHRPPERLSPLVNGLSGTHGRKVVFRYNGTLKFQPLPHLHGSVYESNPVIGLFGVLDLAFVVQVVLSLAVLLFTYDAVCGEKEAGTLRLVASFAVPRSTLALAKLAGSTLAVLVPLAFSFLLAAAILALSPDVALTSEDWVRASSMMLAFAVYLMVFAAFGLWASALCQRRITSFLVLVGLWALWVFAIPNLAVRVSEAVYRADRFDDLEAEGNRLRWEMAELEFNERTDYWRGNASLYGLRLVRHDEQGNITSVDTFAVNRAEMGTEENWKGFLEWVDREGHSIFPVDYDDLGVDARNGLMWHRRFVEPFVSMTARWRDEYRTRLRGRAQDRSRQLQRQQQLARVLGGVSPLAATTFATMDLARVGAPQEARLEKAISEYHSWYLEFIWQKEALFKNTRRRRDDPEPTLDGFQPFVYQESEPVEAVLSRNLLPFANLLLLGLLGFIGAYVAMLRYDVR